jgi:hypothetical protein
MVPPTFNPWIPEVKPEPFESIVLRNQQTPVLPRRLYWDNYKLIAEGHFIQIYAGTAWHFYLPFSGEGEMLELKHVKNLEDMDEDDDQGSPQSIPSTHRDF